MQSFKNILIVLDFNAGFNRNSALLKGLDLANRNKAKVTLTSIIDTPKNLVRDYTDSLNTDDLVKLLLSERETLLCSLRDSLKDENPSLDINTVVAGGVFAIEIIKQALINKHDLVIKTAEKKSGNFSSGDLQLMRKCPKPLWLVKPDQNNTTAKIVAAVDLSMEHESEGKSINHSILKIACSLSEIENGELHLVSCWSLYGEASLRNSGFLKQTEDKVELLLEKEKQANQKTMDDLAARYNKGIKKVLIKGDPKIEIPSYVQKHSIDAVVMGTMGRSGIAGLLIGNTAETVIQNIDSSVVTLKPSAFETPVKV